MARLSLWTVAAAVAALAGCSGGSVERARTPVERGRYLVTAVGCADCHTPLRLGAKGPEPDPARHLSGHPEQLGALASPRLPDPPWGWAGTLTSTAFAGPWGISYATNLTPDDETGIGAWTEATFIQAIRSGRHLGGGRPILPPMPWPAYASLDDDDLKAIFAYLKSIPPITNRVPDALVASHAPSDA